MKTEKIEACIEYVRHMETCGIGQRDPNKCGATEARTELAALKADRDKWELALTGLTPGGSEFVGDPEYCVEWVRRHEESMKRAMLRFKDRADKAIRLVQGWCKFGDALPQDVRDKAWHGLRARSSTLPEGDKGATVPLREETIKEYLDSAIRRWRGLQFPTHVVGNVPLNSRLSRGIRSQIREDERIMASYYIDAFQSVRTSLFGELLPEEED